jgi:hypothetical protein
MRVYQPEVDRFGQVWRGENYEREGRCPDCGAHIGELHVLGCDIERCGVCGGSFTDCKCINKCSIHRKPVYKCGLQGRTECVLRVTTRERFAWTPDYNVIVDSVKEEYTTKNGNTAIRRVNIMGDGRRIVCWNH